jgi:hypothetical protein
VSFGLESEDLARREEERKLAGLRRSYRELSDLQDAGEGKLLRDADGRLWLRVIGQPADGRHPEDSAFAVTSKGVSWFERPAAKQPQTVAELEARLAERERERREQERERAETAAELAAGTSRVVGFGDLWRYLAGGLSLTGGSSPATLRAAGELIAREGGRLEVKSGRLHVVIDTLSPHVRSAAAMLYACSGADRLRSPALEEAAAGSCDHAGRRADREVTEILRRPQSAELQPSCARRCCVPPSSTWRSSFSASSSRERSTCGCARPDTGSSGARSGRGIRPGRKRPASRWFIGTPSQAPGYA